MLLPLSPTLAHGVHAVFEYGAIAIGMALYRRARERSGLPAMSAGGGMALLVGLLLGAGLGNKLVFLFERPDLWWAYWREGAPLVLGQSIVGGLLGGLIGIEIAKACTHQRASTGDLMVGPLALGMGLGRVGCFLAGLNDDTYGLPTTLPWGVDLGDGIWRHPSPLYEMIFLALLVAVLERHRPALSRVPGLAFKLFLASYLLWRLVGDSLKPVRVPYAFGLSGIQWVCVAALLLYLPLVARALRRAPPPNPDPIRTPATTEST